MNEAAPLLSFNITSAATIKVPVSSPDRLSCSEDRTGCFWSDNDSHFQGCSRFPSVWQQQQNVLTPKKDPSGTLPSFMSPAVDICLRFISFDSVELPYSIMALPRISQGKFVFMPRQNGDWRKVSFFLRSDNFNYGLLTDAGNCT